MARKSSSVQYHAQHHVKPNNLTILQAQFLLALDIMSSSRTSVKINPYSSHVRPHVEFDDVSSELLDPVSNLITLQGFKTYSAPDPTLGQTLYMFQDIYPADDII